MSSDFVPVINDAVKIGLGALIAGFFTVLTPYVNSSRKLRESLTEQRRKSLQEIAEEISDIHTLFGHQSSTVAASLSIKGRGGKILRESIEDYLMELSPEIETALYKLHHIESRLCLIGYEHISAEVEVYRHALTDFTNLDSDWTLTKQEAFCEAYSQSILKARLIVFRSLAKAFSNG